MHVILHVTNRNDNKQCAGYYRLQIEKTTNSAQDTTSKKNRKDNKQCAAGYYRLQIEKTSNSARDTTGYK